MADTLIWVTCQNHKHIFEMRMEHLPETYTTHSSIQTGLQFICKFFCIPTHGVPLWNSLLTQKLCTCLFVSYLSCSYLLHSSRVISIWDSRKSKHVHPVGCMICEVSAPCCRHINRGKWTMGTQFRRCLHYCINSFVGHSAEPARVLDDVHGARLHIFPVEANTMAATCVCLLRPPNLTNLW